MKYRGGVGLKGLFILNYILLIITLIGTSVAVNDYVQQGFSFEMNQSVNGTGFTSTRSCINVDPELLQAHSAGSGSYTYDSSFTIRNYDVVDDISDLIPLKDLETPVDNYISSERSVELQATTGFAYSPAVQPNMGTFRSGPIKSLWTDSTVIGNGGGAYMKLGYDNVQSLSTDVHSKVSGLERIDSLQGTTSGTFNAGMKVNAAFTGNERLEVDLKDPGKKVPTTLMDELYSGTFTTTKNLELSDINTATDYGEDSEGTGAINWLPCSCFEGFDDMDLHDQRYHSASDFFDCTTCGFPQPCSSGILPKP
ncbi:MAG: hypothetical protein ABR985_04310 [Methanotrichaceae archaeon]